MSTILIIARRELRERSFVFLTALAVATMPFIIALLPGASSFGRGEIVGAVGVIGACAFAFGLAVIFGSSIIGRELSDGRLSFYFSKPLSAASIWFGKLTAALFAIVATFAMIGLPAYFGGGQRWRAVWTMQPLLIGSAFLGLTILTLLLFHAVSTMVRSRSPLVLVDLALFVAAIMAMTMLSRPLMNALASQLAQGLTIAIVIAFGLVLAIAPVWQLSRGRTDRRRNHIELSKVVWISAAAILLVAAAYVGWVLSADPGDLNELTAVQSPAGPWLYASGKTGGRFDYRTTFLINAATGEPMRVPAPDVWHAGFTHNGSAAYWLRPVAVQGSYFRAQLWYRRLDGAAARPVDTNIEVGPMAAVAMTDDLSRAAVIDDQMLSIHDLAHNRIVGSVRLPSTRVFRYSIYFTGPDVVRVIERLGGSLKDPSVVLRIYEFDAPRRALTRTGAATLVTKNLSLEATEDGSRLLVRLFPAHVAMVLDARTAAKLVEWQPGTIGGFPHLLAGGSLAGFVRNGEELSFRTVAPDGAIVSEVKLPAAKYAAFARELAPGKVLVSLGTPGSKALVIDVKRGVIEKSVDGLRLVTDSSTASDPRSAAIDPSQPVVGVDAAGSLVRWNPATGERGGIL